MKTLIFIFESAAQPRFQKYVPGFTQCSVPCKSFDARAAFVALTLNPSPWGRGTSNPAPAESDALHRFHTVFS